MKLRLLRFFSNEHGATVVEYAFILLASALALIATAPLLGSKLLAIWNNFISQWTY